MHPMRIVNRSRHLLPALLAALATVATALPGYASPPTTWKMSVGAEANGAAIQANAFLPQTESIAVGDSVTWTVRTGEFHTISFLSGGPQPTFLLPGPPPAVNPQVAAPAGGSAYAGSGYFNSGLLRKEQSYTLTFSAPGDYSFLCLVHPDMTGTLHVASSKSASPHTQGFYDRLAGRASEHLFEAGQYLRAEGLAVAGAEANQVVAGTGAVLPGTASLFIARFLPGPTVVHVGETITWTNIDPATPHTVTFGQEPGSGNGGPLAAFAPSGVDRIGHATITAQDQAVNSGFIGANVPFGATFSATFTRPGVYSYICALHDTLGMTGVIDVLPGSRDDDAD